MAPFGIVYFMFTFGVIIVLSSFSLLFCLVKHCDLYTFMTVIMYLTERVKLCHRAKVENVLESLRFGDFPVFY